MLNLDSTQPSAILRLLKRRLPSWLAVLLLAPFTCPATGFTGTLLGRVTDSSGQAVPSAKLVVRNVATNTSRELTSDVLGEFVVSLLPPGTYEVTARAGGFRPQTLRAITLDVDQTTEINFTLQVGELHEQVVVTVSTSLLETESSALGQVIGPQPVAALPLNERNFLAFTLLVPGVQMSADGSQNSSQGGAISVDGAREQANNFLLDGADNNDSVVNQFSALPSVDAIQEFKVQSSNSSAEFGRSGGAQINVVLKGGSNDFHGSLFEFFRNRHLDAKNFFDLSECVPTSASGTCGSIPRFDRNQFGGSLGGPLRRDKSFSFLSYETLRLRQATTREATVPSLAQRDAALAAVPQDVRNPAGVAVFDLLPAANVGPDLGLSNSFVSPPTIRETVHFLLLKFDHVLTSKDTMSSHYALFDDSRFNPFDPLASVTNLPGYGTLWMNRGQNFGISWTRQASVHLTNEFRFGFNRRRGGIFQQSLGTDQNQKLGFPSVSSNPADWGYPIVVLAGFDGIGEPRIYPQDRHVNTFHAADTLAWNPAFGSARHQFKFGADIRRIQANLFIDALARGEWFFLGTFTGDSLQDLLRGLPTFALAAGGDTPAGLRTIDLNFFVQDDMRLTSRFTINMGLRWEYNQPPVEVRDRLSAPDLTANSASCTPKPDCQFIIAGTRGLPRATYSRDLNNFAPRIGFAWRPLASTRIAVRSSYGIFYDVGILNANFYPRANPPFFDIGLFLNFGTSSIQNILSQPAFPQSPVATMLDPGYRDGYMQRWNLDTQFEPLQGTVIDLAYVGSKGTDLATQRNLNQAPPGTGAFPFPQFGPINLIQSTASSSYHSLQFRAERRFNHGLSYLAGYTWSRSIDDASALFATGAEPGFAQNSLDLGAEKGLSNFHAKHRMVVNFIYRSPVSEGNGRLRDHAVLHYLLRDWQLSSIVVIQSGRPFTVNRGIDQSHSGTVGLGIFADRPNQMADPFRPGPVAANPDPLCALPISLGGHAADHVRTPQTWFNPCAFADPGVAFGNAGRNSLIGPGLTSFDFSFAREILLRSERHRLQFRADFFNFFNHPNFDLPDRSFDSRTFSRLNTANVNGIKPPRQIQFAIRYSF